MPKFPADAPIRDVIKALERLGFSLVRQGNHVSMLRKNPDGTHTPLTLPNHPRIKGSTLRTIPSHLPISKSHYILGNKVQDRKAQLQNPYAYRCQDWHPHTHRTE
jgi:predicted RNA binding protein YcfA (HicA-like mRNA interferase family)